MINASSLRLEGLDILVVEDDPTSLMFMSSLLAKHGCTVTTASNGHEAFEKFKLHRYPVVVTDINMPVMNGIELVRNIRQRDAYTQIIATSLNCETECLISAIQLGFNDYILKPVKAAELLWSVKRCVDTIANMKRLKDEQEKICDLAFHDPLTSLPNRRLFDDRLSQAIAKSHRYQMKFGLLYLDLDHFKQVNDNFGHEAGDQVLVETSQRIESCCKRDHDTICRQGGDEFSVIITDCGGRLQLEEIAEKLIHKFRQPFKVNGTEVTVTACIGISLFPDNGTGQRDLKIASDTAMYAAKQAGRNCWQVS